MVPWWTSELEVMRKVRALRRLFQCETDESRRAIRRISYTQQLAVYKRMISKSKKFGFRSFLQSINSTDQIFGRRGMMCWKSGNTKTAEFKLDDDLEIRQKMSEELFEYHFSYSKRILSSLVNTDASSIEAITMEELNYLF